MKLKELTKLIDTNTYVVIKSQDKAFEGYLGDMEADLRKNGFDDLEVGYIEVDDETSVYNAKLKVLVGEWKQ